MMNTAARESSLQHFLPSDGSDAVRDAHHHHHQVHHHHPHHHPNSQLVSHNDESQREGLLLGRAQAR